MPYFLAPLSYPLQRNLMLLQGLRTLDAPKFLMPPSILPQPLTCTDFQKRAKDGLSRQRSESRITAAGCGIETMGIAWAPSTGSCGKWTSRSDFPQKMPAASWEQGDGGRRRKRCLSSYKEKPLVIDWKFEKEEGSLSQSLRRPLPRINPC